jgi:hypothetical protein
VTVGRGVLVAVDVAVIVGVSDGMGVAVDVGVGVGKNPHALRINAVTIRLMTNFENRNISPPFVLDFLLQRIDINHYNHYCLKIVFL